MSQGSMHIRISLNERYLYLYSGNKLHGSYPIAIGKPSTPSPVGKWNVANKSILAGGTVYGTRWIGLSIDNYGIHGNNNANAIGKAVSLGCIRMYNNDIESIFPLITLNTPVEILSTTHGSGYPLPHYEPKENIIDSSYTPSPGKRIYVIKQGDTLWSIAQHHQTTVDILSSLNPSINPNLIYPGHVLYLP
jgi:LysM repeat protein